MKTVYQKHINQITDIVKSSRLISDRIIKLKAAGFYVGRFYMGSGGVLQVKSLKAEYRVQISHGIGKHNYAYVVVLYK